MSSVCLKCGGYGETVMGEPCDCGAKKKVVMTSKLKDGEQYQRKYEAYLLTQLLCESSLDEITKLKAAYTKDKNAFNALANRICSEV